MIESVYMIIDGNGERVKKLNVKGTNLYTSLGKLKMSLKEYSKYNKIPNDWYIRQFIFLPDKKFSINEIMKDK